MKFKRSTSRKSNFASLNKEYIINRTAEIEKLMEELEELNRILGDDNEVKNIIADQLKKIAKKYGQENACTGSVTYC